MDACHTLAWEGPMDTASAPIPPAAANAFLGCAPDDDIPLGWECANPALQIECWGTEEAGGTPAGHVIES